VRFGLDGLLAEVPAAQIDESRTVYSSRPAGRGPGTLGQLHDVRARKAAPAPVDPPAVEEIVEAEGARVAVRIFTPTAAKSRGVYLDIHGGGFYMDFAARSDARNRELADALKLAVVSVDYRFAPEHPWPAAPDDCATAGLWLLEEAEARFGTSPTGDRRKLGGGDTRYDNSASTARWRGRRRICGCRAPIRHIRVERTDPGRTPDRRRVLHRGIRRPCSRPHRPGRLSHLRGEISVAFLRSC
jgi:hypothetical protein